jgi:hypothetical protein
VFTLPTRPAASSIRLGWSVISSGRPLAQAEQSVEHMRRLRARGDVPGEASGDSLAGWLSIDREASPLTARWRTVRRVQTRIAHRGRASVALS